MGTSEITKRKIMPEEVVKWGDYLYLVGYCHLRNEKRSFRLDRILNLI